MTNLVVGKLPEMIQNTGSFGSIRFSSSSCTADSHTIFSNFTTTTTIVPTTIVESENRYAVYGAIISNVELAMESVGGHEIAVQGNIHPLHIKLDDTTGRPGDMIIRTNDGPRWLPDYYSTYYDLRDNTNPVVLGNYDAFVVDPRNGFTQFAGIDLDGNTIGGQYRFVFVKGLPTGRIWRVRVHVYIGKSQDFMHTFLDRNSTGDSASFRAYGELQPIFRNNTSEEGEGDLHWGGTNLYEFFTYNGGSIWYWIKLSGMSVVN